MEEDTQETTTIQLVMRDLRFVYVLSNPLICLHDQPRLSLQINDGMGRQKKRLQDREEDFPSKSKRCDQSDKPVNAVYI